MGKALRECKFVLLWIKMEQGAVKIYKAELMIIRFLENLLIISDG